jgi:chromosome segregation ATPase
VPQAPIPQTRELERAEARRALTVASDGLARAQGSFAEKIDKLKKRSRAVQRDQERLRLNLVKYNNFVKEKQSKVEASERVVEEERDYQENIEKLIAEKKEEVEVLKKAQDIMAEAVKKREVFREYLQKVVAVEGGAKNRYHNIYELMKRCETLVVTRDVAKENLKRCLDEISDVTNYQTVC